MLCGGGNNGGDGVAAARYLKGWGYLVNEVYWLKNPARMGRRCHARRHYQMAKRCGVPFFSFSRIQPHKRVSMLAEAAVLIDALLGTGTSGHLKIPMFRRHCRHRPQPPSDHRTVDLPSGLDPRHRQGSRYRCKSPRHRHLRRPKNRPPQKFPLAPTSANISSPILAFPSLFFTPKFLSKNLFELKN